jgi:hypothetical protein
MSVKYNSVDRVGVHGWDSSIVRWLHEVAAWLTFTSKTGDTIAGFMVPQVVVPVRVPARIRTFASQGR